MLTSAVQDEQALRRIASALEKMAGTKNDGRDNMRQLAARLNSSNIHDWRRGLEELQHQQALITTEAEIASELAAVREGFKLLRLETLDGREYQPAQVNPIVSTPNKIKQYLDTIVVGQETATMSFAVGLTDISCRLSPDNFVKIEPNNYLVFGPSGVGKTYLAFTATKLIGLPCVKVSATALGQIGSGGVDFRDILREFCIVEVYGNRKGQEQRRLKLRNGATHGCLFIDEIDKLRDRQNLQHDLLPILDRGTYQLGEGLSFDTSNLWVIVSGKFEGLDKIISDRLEDNKQSDENTLKRATERDFVEFGFISELARRFQAYVPFQPLSETALYSILVDTPQSLLKQYQSRFRIHGYNFQIDEDALKAIVRWSMDNSEGANGLKVAMYKVTEGILFAPGKYGTDGVITLTQDMVRGILQ